MKQRSVCLGVLIFAMWILSLPQQLKAQQAKHQYNPFEDTVCVRYTFFANDSAVYELRGQDSISGFEPKPVLKKRVERFAIVCDSVSADGKFFLRSVILSANGTQSGEFDGQKIENEPLPQTLYSRSQFAFSMDSTGKIFEVQVLPAKLSFVSPGGVFQPTLFPHGFGECRAPQVTWLIDNDENWLPMNSSATPSRRDFGIFRPLEDLDTLGERCSSIQYSLTATGAVRLQEAKPPMVIVGTINEFGRVAISERFRIPLHLFASNEQRLTLTTRGGKESKGKHHTKVEYQLLKLLRNGRIVYTVPPAAQHKGTSSRTKSSKQSSGIGSKDKKETKKRPSK